MPNGNCHTIATKVADGDARLVQISESIRVAITVGGPIDLAVIEDLPVGARSAGITGMVHGVVRETLNIASVPYALISPATLKAYATGAGNADKTAMALAAFKRYGIEFADDNQCDAWWLRAAGLQHLGEPLVSLPAAQIARLDKAKWPAR
ncbi:Holliday junction endonuclease [Kitasatospora sp. CB02891]|nr:Holliday junction endonuclease [Kitasatospora sp. CB02891]